MTEQSAGVGLGIESAAADASDGVRHRRLVRRNRLTELAPAMALAPSVEPGDAVRVTQPDRTAVGGQAREPGSHASRLAQCVAHRADSRAERSRRGGPTPVSTPSRFASGAPPQGRSTSRLASTGPTTCRTGRETGRSTSSRFSWQGEATDERRLDGSTASGLVSQHERPARPTVTSRRRAVPSMCRSAMRIREHEEGR